MGLESEYDPQEPTAEELEEIMRLEREGRVHAIMVAPYEMNWTLVIARRPPGPSGLIPYTELLSVQPVRKGDLPRTNADQVHACLTYVRDVLTADVYDNQEIGFIALINEEVR